MIGKVKAAKLASLHEEGRLSLRDICKIADVPYSTVHWRMLGENGMTLAEALTAEKDERKPSRRRPFPVIPAVYEWDGQSGTASWWAKQLGLSVSGMKSRITKYGPRDPRAFEEKHEMKETFEGLSNRDRSYVLDRIPSPSWGGI